jgi:hypothetical protein
LTVLPGAWSNSPSSYAYQWQRLESGSWDDIDNATSRGYTPKSDDIGHRLRATVVATNDDGSAAAASAATAPIGASGVQHAASASSKKAKASRKRKARASKKKTHASKRNKKR